MEEMTRRDDWVLHEPVTTLNMEGEETEWVIIGCTGPGCKWQSSDQSYSHLGFSSHLSAISGTPSYIVDYWKNWAMHVEVPFGQLSRDAVARELSDYERVMYNASTVYSQIAGLSKPNTDPAYILQAAEDLFADTYAELLCKQAHAAESGRRDELRDALILIAEEWQPGAWARFLKRSARTATVEPTV